MSALPKRDVAPALYWTNPDCSVCGKETSHDGDSLYCEHCGAYWPDDNGEGVWADEDTEQCASTHQPLARNQFAVGKPYQFETKRCLLDADHKPPHRVDAITEWTDETAVSGLGPADGAA